MASIMEVDIDQPTVDLIIELQLQDASSYFESSKGKSRDPTDEDLAFRLQSEEWEGIVQFHEDRRMARSFAAAVYSDGPILAETQVEEQNASKDRQLAQEYMEGNPNAPLDDYESHPAMLDSETLTKLQILYMTGYRAIGDMGTADPETEEAESSAWAARRPGPSLSRSRQCIACREQIDFVDVARVPCQHEYCRSCLHELFTASITDESLFPPRCCRQPIDINIARIFLKSDLVSQYEKKRIEFETPNRTYCYSSSCGMFVGASHINGEVATCPNCGHTTCTNCKERAHIGDCPNDTAMAQLLATAQERGWQRCHSCWRVVELDHGCNHMTCRCGAQFCYTCGEQWKKCGCQHWDERRLLARAYQIIDREEAEPLAAAVPPPDADEPDINEPNTIEPDAIEPNTIEPDAIEPGTTNLNTTEPEISEPEINEVQPENQLILEINDTPMPTQEAPLDEGAAESHEILEAPVIPPHQTARDILIARTIQELKNNHECIHSRWKYIRGPHRCEECFYHLPKYIFECHQCRIQACQRCRRNRL